MHHNLIDTDENFDIDDADQGLESEQCRDWLLICPPKNWKEPVPIALQELRLLELVSQRLNLVINLDHKRKKIYIGSDLVEELDEDETPAEPGPEQGKLRYPSGWMAEVISDQQAGSAYRAIDQVTAPPLIPAFPDAKLSEHFELSEFRPGEHSYKYIRISPSLIQTLEVIRKRVGAPLRVTSGYRPEDYNRKAGGVSNSSHIDGLAADICVDEISTEQLHAICDDVIGSRGGVGFYPRSGFVHVDLRGYRARWSGS